MTAQDCLRMGRFHLQRQQYREATAYFACAISLNPTSAFTYVQLALTEKEQGNYELALEYCGHAIKHQPNSAEAHALLGDLYFTKKQFQEAVTAYELAIQRGEDKFHMLELAYTNLGDEVSARNVRLKPLQRLNGTVGSRSVNEDFRLFEQRFFQMPATNPMMIPPVPGTPSTIQSPGLNS